MSSPNMSFSGRSSSFSNDSPSLGIYAQEESEEAEEISVKPDLSAITQLIEDEDVINEDDEIEYDISAGTHPSLHAPRRRRVSIE